MSKPTATHDALSTTELLEQILSYLSVEDLILLRRVCRHWRNVMANSLVLRRAMFLAPEPELSFEWHLQSVALDQAWSYTKKPSGAVPEPGETVLQSSRFNPLLFERKLGIEAEGTSNGQESVRLHARNDIFIEGGNNLFTEMFTAQPPVTHAFVASTILIELHKGNGIRVADIIEALRHSFDYSYARHRNILSIVVPDVMFSSTDEEKQGLIVHPYRSLRAFYPQVHYNYTW